MNHIDCLVSTTEFAVVLDLPEENPCQLFLGEAAALSANGIIEILKTEPELYSEIWAIHHISKRRWNVLMKNGVTIKLPEIQPGFAWSRLARFDYKNQIIQRDLAVIDMRLPDQIFN